MLQTNRGAHNGGGGLNIYIVYRRYYKVDLLKKLEERVSSSLTLLGAIY